MSELIREALRHYERRLWWDDVNAYSRARAERQGLREEDVDRLGARAGKRAAKIGIPSFSRAAFIVLPSAAKAGSVHSGRCGTTGSRTLPR